MAKLERGDLTEYYKRRSLQTGVELVIEDDLEFQAEVKWLSSASDEQQKVQGERVQRVIKANTARNAIDDVLHREALERNQRDAAGHAAASQRAKSFAASEVKRMETAASPTPKRRRKAS